MAGIRSSYTDNLSFFGPNDPLDLVAAYGSPLYVYSESVLRARCDDMKSLFKDPSFVVSYSTKANPNPHLLRIIKDQGLHADAMSPGELAMVKAAGFTKDKISYVSNNISEEELGIAARESNFVSVDSLAQLDSFGRVNPGGKVVVRVNPGIGAGHHQKVVTAGKDTKFAVSPEDFKEMRAILARHNLTLQGLNQHVGSLFMDAAPYLAAASWLLETAEEFPGITIIDFGGGFGIPYRKYENQPRLDIADLSAKFTDLLLSWKNKHNYAGKFVIEPGRYIAAECGILLGRVHAVKNNGATRYAGTDLGFNTLIRPAMYESFHDVEIFGKPGLNRPVIEQTIAGNICETGDIIAKGRNLPEIYIGDVAAMLDAGAYGHSMSSNYNQRLRPAEVLIESSGAARLIRKRDSVEDLMKVYPDL